MGGRSTDRFEVVVGVALLVVSKEGGRVRLDEGMSIYSQAMAKS